MYITRLLFSSLFARGQFLDFCSSPIFLCCIFSYVYSVYRFYIFLFHVLIVEICMERETTKKRRKTFDSLNSLALDLLRIVVDSDKWATSVHYLHITDSNVLLVWTIRVHTWKDDSGQTRWNSKSVCLCVFVCKPENRTNVMHIIDFNGVNNNTHSVHFSELDSKELGQRAKLVRKVANTEYFKTIKENQK